MQSITSKHCECGSRLKKVKCTGYNGLARYNRHIVGSGVKHHNPNRISTFLSVTRPLLAHLHILCRNNYEEIDLFVGGMSENRVKGGDVGPTFACLLAKQFDFMKRGDSFWYERKSGPGKEFNQGLYINYNVMSSELKCYELFKKFQSNKYICCWVFFMTVGQRLFIHLNTGMW